MITLRSQPMLGRELVYRSMSLGIVCLFCGPGCSNGDPTVAGSAHQLKTGFPVYDVRDYGAVGDGQTLESNAIQKTIDAAAAAGGGCVFLPPGNYLSGTVQLKDNITIYLENGCTVWGSKRLSDYDPKHTHLFYALDSKNILVSGPGEINGNGPSFWDNGRLQKWLKKEIELPRTKEMIRFDRCNNVTLENIQIKDGAFWNIGFGDCNEIAIRGVRIRNGVYEDDGPNTDGINLWNCQKVQISNCDIVAGDDCIVVLGESRDVTITNCQLQTSETALMISGARNLSFSNSTIHDAGCGIGFRVWNDIVVDGVTVNNIVMDVSDRFKGGGTAIYLWSFPIYTEIELPSDAALPPPGVIKNVTISNVIASANGLVCVNGARNGYVEGLTLDNIRFEMYGGKTSEFNADPPYPYPIYGFHHGSPYGLFFRHVDELMLRDIHVKWNTPEKPEWGSALRCWNARNVQIDGFVGRQSKNSNRPSISLKDVDGAFVHHCRSPIGTGTFLELNGKTHSVTLIGNDLSLAKKSIANRAENTEAVFMQNNHLPVDESHGK